VSAEDVVRSLETNRVLAVIRARSADEAVAYSAEIVRGGIQVVEVSFNTPDTVDAIRELAAIPGAIIGAGTVRTKQQVDQVVDAGAVFMVTPHTDPAIVSHAVEAGLVVGSGVMTPTDCAMSLDAGAHFLKLFPAHIAGIEAMKAYSQPFPEARWIPTGGIGTHNMLQWLAAGASAVGLGSELTASGVEQAAAKSSAVMDTLRQATGDSGR
jgi:2-dehydro-3-deoxyphosphogluconate aldolase / (4S)-4-hydroxy-2-oxoglutarate aldolase